MEVRYNGACLLGALVQRAHRRAPHVVRLRQPQELGPIRLAEVADAQRRVQRGAASATALVQG